MDGKGDTHGEGGLRDAYKNFSRTIEGGTFIGIPRHK
jgi:hypothetical protein